MRRRTAATSELEEGSVAEKEVRLSSPVARAVEERW